MPFASQKPDILATADSPSTFNSKFSTLLMVQVSPQSTPFGLPEESAPEGIASKTFYSICASKFSSVVSLVLGRKPSDEQASQASSKPPSIFSSASRSSSTSIAATDHTVQVPDCGDTIHVPEFGESVREPRITSLHEHLKAICKKLLHPHPMKLDMQNSTKDNEEDGSDHSSGNTAVPEVNENIEPWEAGNQDEDAEEGSSEVGDDEDDDDDDDDEEEDDYPRCDFKTIEAISDEKYQDLIRICCHLTDTTQDIRIVGRTKGTYNAATFVDLHVDGKVHKYVVRVPGHGTHEHWTPEDVYMMEREAQLIEHIRKNTIAPVPEVIHYSTEHTNVLGFPYILMTKLPGKTADSIWFNQGYDPANADYAYRTADVPFTATEKKRITFLRSLARVMTEIQALSFDSIGMPIFTADGLLDGIGPSYHWGSGVSDESTERLSSSTTQEYVQNAFKEKFKPQFSPTLDKATCNLLGIRAIFRIIFSQPVFDQPTPETFTIRHNDLDLQNILVDDEGNVTGIIDWDSAIAAPRCVGAAAVPLFLRNDWFPRYTHDIRLAPYMAWNYHYYRQIYAVAMIEAGNTDAKFTVKSAIYQAAVSAVTEGGDANDLISKLLREIPNCRVDADDFKLGLGLGWPAAVDMLKVQLAKIFEPELSPAGLLEELDAELELKGWWNDFDSFLEAEPEVQNAVNACAEDEDEDEDEDEAEGEQGNESETDSG